MTLQSDTFAPTKEPPRYSARGWAILSLTGFVAIAICWLSLTWADFDMPGAGVAMIIGGIMVWLGPLVLGVAFLGLVMSAIALVHSLLRPSAYRSRWPALAGVLVALAEVCCYCLSIRSVSAFTTERSSKPT